MGDPVPSHLDIIRGWYESLDERTPKERETLVEVLRRQFSNSYNIIFTTPETRKESGHFKRVMRYIDYLSELEIQVPEGKIVEFVHTINDIIYPSSEVVCSNGQTTSKPSGPRYGPKRNKI